MRLVFWHNILSLHQSALARALADSGHDVVVVAAEEISAARCAAGWNRPDFGKARILIAPERTAVSELVKQGLPDTIHIVAGARWTPLGRWATDSCVRHRARLGIMSEAADHRGWKGVLRWARYATERFVVGGCFDFVLGIGEQGVRWFRRCGYAVNKTFTFAYLTEAPRSLPLPTHEVSSGAFELIFLGRLVEGKGLGKFLLALEGCQDLHWRLTVVGSGPLGNSLQRVAADRHPAGWITFLPFMENPAALQTLSKMDLLALPSQGKEGWGAVVNEALMCGVPVLCSDACGAADLLQESWRGEVFPAGSVPRLTECLRRWISRGRTTPELRARIRSWSECITGESGARYLERILRCVYENGPRPAVPWRNKP